MDTVCTQPIDEWNADHGHDAALLLGIENFDAKRMPHHIHVESWAIASMPGHPLLTLLPGVVSRQVQKQFFALARKQGSLNTQQYEQWVVERSGPAALTGAMYEYFSIIGMDLNKFAQTATETGVRAGGVRVLPHAAMGQGWEVAVARHNGQNYTCADVAHDSQSLVCHLFWGSWRSNWRFKERMTYGNCDFNV